MLKKDVIFEGSFDAHPHPGRENASSFFNFPRGFVQVVLENLEGIRGQKVTVSVVASDAQKKGERMQPSKLRRRLLRGEKLPNFPS